MRILYVGHAYLVAENRKKLRELAQLPGVELRLIVPHRWPRTMHGDLPNEPLREDLFPVLPLRTFLAGHEMVYGYWNPGGAFQTSFPGALSASEKAGMPPSLPVSGRKGGQGDERGWTPDVICVEQGAGAFSLFQCLRARDRLAPRAKVVFFTWWNLPHRSRQPLRALEAYNLRHADGGIAGNADARDILRAHGFHGPLRVLPQLGVDPDVFCKQEASALRAELGLGPFVVGFAGRFVPEKGLRVLAEAALGLGRPADLLLLGSGPLASEVRERIAAKGSGINLRVVNSVPHADVPRYLNCMDVFVLPSLTTTFWKEQFGHVLIEAFACETPVVGSSSSEIPNVVGDAGIIVPEGDAAALRSAVIRLADDPALRTDLARRGRARALAHYTNRRIAQSSHEFFKELAG